MPDEQGKPVTRPGVRPSAPHLDGPLGSSGAAPSEPVPQPHVPAPRRPETLADVTPSSGPTEAGPIVDGGRGAAGEGAGGAAPKAATGSPPTNDPIGPGATDAAGGLVGLAATKTDIGAGTPGTRGAESSGNQAGPAADDRKSGPAPGGSTPGRSAASGAAPGEAAPGEAGAGGAGVKAEHKPRHAAAAAGAGGGSAVTKVLQGGPVRLVRMAGRNTSAWAKRPAGRLLVPAIVAVLLLTAAGTAGAYLVPAALDSGPAPVRSVSAAPSAEPVPGLSGVPSAVVTLPSGVVPSGPGLPGGLPTATGVPGATAGARPADALATWAQGVGTRVGIPVVAVQAYGYAELVLQRTTPNCRLSWTTIAAIAKVESSHGSANGAVLGVDGSVQPPIYGLPLDGKGGRQLIRDTDQGTLDKDTTYDRAVGPLQFIPQTWREVGVDADNDQVVNPNDIDDASLSAAVYLCRNGRDMSKPDAWWEAILSYNAVRPYAQKVFDTANDYGRRSRV